MNAERGRDLNLLCKVAVEEKCDWRTWVTPTPLKDKPVHRWYYFPHSFTAELVHALIDEWKLKETDCILDPFCGAGTTLLAAKTKGVPAKGYDLSPLAVLAARTKAANYSRKRLLAAWDSLRDGVSSARWNGPSRTYPELVKRALPGKLLGAFDLIDTTIESLQCSETERNFFRLALLNTMPRYSRAVATGGWLSWADTRANSRSLLTALSKRVEAMLDDLENAQLPRRSDWHVAVADARKLPDPAGSFSAVITSPPYPNRHDYTRVFGVELMFKFLNWSQTRRLRYQSFHSHPEARPVRPISEGYSEPKSLTGIIRRVEKSGIDARIPKMLKGYFLDLFLCLREVNRVCRPGAKVAFVVGNAQYCNETILVDELTAEIGEQAGLKCTQLLAVRYRGNSAQQMSTYGRHPSRESVVVFSARTAATSC